MVSAPTSGRYRNGITVLVDYDHVPPAVRRRGLSDLVGRVLSLLPSATLPRGARAWCRLYGGWFEKRDLSPRAQELAAEIRRTFPTTLRLGTATDPVRSMSRSNSPAACAPAPNDTSSTLTAPGIRPGASPPARFRSPPAPCPATVPWPPCIDSWRPTPAHEPPARPGPAIS